MKWENKETKLNQANETSKTNKKSKKSKISEKSKKGRLNKKGLKLFCKVVFSFFVIAGAVVLAFYLCGWRVNITGSMPVGIYQESSKSAIKIGDYVEVCLPDYLAKEGMKKGYISGGSCANGSEPLVKKLIALPQDEVYLANNDMIFVYEKDKYGENKAFKRYPAPIQKQSFSGKPIKRYVTFGTFHNDGFWVYGFDDWKYSWDSRYFGGLPYDSLVAVLEPVWVLK